MSKRPSASQGNVSYFLTRHTCAHLNSCSAGGIGHALAKEFHARGFRVFATSRTLSSMAELAELGIETSVLDVTKSSDIATLKNNLAEGCGGKLDVLINNAGIAYPFAVSDFDMERVKALFDVNVFGAMDMTHQLLPLLIQAKGRLFKSAARLRSCLSHSTLPTTLGKLRYIHSGDTLRVELAPFGVRVITIAAGCVETNIMKPETLPSDSIYQPIREEYQSLRLEHFQDGAIPAQDFARIVADEALSQNPKAWLWTATHSWTTWCIHTFGGRRAFDSILSKMFGVNKLAERL
ncbi:NAD-P-binding protein [Mycena epipterygia]|nr:NAD-P-binding protein [Mycena epipterygia]